jgi:hypothetical protein
MTRSEGAAAVFYWQLEELGNVAAGHACPGENVKFAKKKWKSMCHISHD